MVGHATRPKVVYSIEQVLQIKVIYRLREELSLQEIRQVLQLLEDKGYEPSLFSLNLLFFNGKLYMLDGQDAVNQKIIELTGKHRGQIVMQPVDPIGDVISSLYKEAERHCILDFDKRLNGTKLSVELLNS